MENRYRFLSLCSNFLLLGMVLFCSRGSLSYVEAWRTLFHLFFPMFLICLGRRLLFPKPESPVMEGRAIDGKKVRRSYSADSLLFLLGLAAAGFAARAGTAMPFAPLVQGVGILFLWLGNLLGLLSIRAGRQIQGVTGPVEGQEIVRRGVYGVIRHPMYASTILLYTGIGLTLCSPFCLFFHFFIFLRIFLLIPKEEDILRRGCPDYADYCRQVSYRLFPGLW